VAIRVRVEGVFFGGGGVVLRGVGVFHRNLWYEFGESKSVLDTIHSPDDELVAAASRGVFFLLFSAQTRENPIKMTREF